MKAIGSFVEGRLPVAERLFLLVAGVEPCNGSSMTGSQAEDMSLACVVCEFI